MAVQPTRAATDPRVVWAIAATVVVAAVLAVAGLLSAGGEAGDVSDALTATPISSAETAQPAASLDGTPNPTPDDVAVFVASVAPGVDGAAVSTAPVELDRQPADAGGEGLVVASVLGGQSRVDVGAWNGSAYEPVLSGDGGTADRIDMVVVGDINGTPSSPEIVVHQSSGEVGQSVTLWSLGDGQITPLSASGGCWDGSSTYGIIGATLEGNRLTATCDGSPLPVVAWPSDVYEWDQEMQAFSYQYTVE